MNNEMNLYVSLYVDSNLDRKLLTTELKKTLNEAIEDRFDIESPQGEISVRKNDAFNEEMRKDEEDGFLYYRYLLEVEPEEELGKENATQFVSRILEYLWSQNYPAVASCDYEELLPNKGGYKSPNVPKPQ